MMLRRTYIWTKQGVHKKLTDLQMNIIQNVLNSILDGGVVRQMALMHSVKLEKNCINWWVPCPKQASKSTTNLPVPCIEWRVKINLYFIGFQHRAGKCCIHLYVYDYNRVARCHKTAMQESFNILAEVSVIVFREKGMFRKAKLERQRERKGKKEHWSHSSFVR